MLRAFFISLSKAKWAQSAITRLPFVWRMASRFVAGETAFSAIQVVRDLNSSGIFATLDYLGENTSSREEALHSTREILAVLDQIHSSGVQANVSVKLSQIGLTIDQAFCQENLGKILDRASDYGNFIRIDMEDSGLTDQTIQVLSWALQQGKARVGIVLQAYLYRTEKDLLQLSADGIPIRLCKGAYNEPTQVAFPKMADVNANYDLLARLMMVAAIAHGSPTGSEDGRIPPLVAIASHDPQRINCARRLAHELGLPHRSVEFQMLFGIRRDLQGDLAEDGYPVRVYVPYGSHWYPYFMRRLAERPANVWFFVSNFFKK
jgi:proline dehydrogenase